MKKKLPANYDVYFFPSGKKRPSPYANPQDENEPIDGKAIEFMAWEVEQHEIWIEIMTDKERSDYELWKNSVQGLHDRMDS